MSTYFDEPRHPRPRPQPRLWPLLMLPLMGLVLAAVFLAWHFGSDLLRPSTSSPPVKMREVKVRDGLFENEKTVIELYKRTKLSVVNVTSLTVQKNVRTRNLDRIPRGMGSGIVWDTQGHIVTNYHVIEGAGAAVITMDDHTEYSASLVGADRNWDLAVLKIDAPSDKLRPIDIGASKDLLVGQSAFTIGNPFGLDHSLGSGIVSALDREMESRAGVTIQGVIQTTAPVNPGNSGGPLPDSDGRLIGINTAIISPSGGWAGIGFALPVDKVNEVVTQVINANR
jgi:S1-C subfamily serine protease